MTRAFRIEVARANRAIREQVTILTTILGFSRVTAKGNKMRKPKMRYTKLVKVIICMARPSEMERSIAS